jgi:hypothetical protein
MERMKHRGLAEALPRGPVMMALRRLAAAALQSASAGLAVVARRIAEAPLPEARSIDPRLEFYAQAGAPEGALYVDGQLVGILPGVRRL